MLSNLRYSRVIATAVIAALPLIGLTACDKQPEEETESSQAIEYNCPEGQVNNRWLIADLDTFSGSSHDSGGRFMTSANNAQIEEKCIGHDEATQMVAKGLPALHKAIDESNTDLDRTAAAIAKTAASLQAITDPKQRLIEVLKTSCEPPSGTYPRTSYEYWATPIVDASPATIDALIARYHKGPEGDRWPLREKGYPVFSDHYPYPTYVQGEALANQPGPMYGRLGTVKSMSQELRAIYDETWGPAYSGQIIDPPREYKDAVQYSCYER